MKWLCVALALVACKKPEGRGNPLAKLDAAVAAADAPADEVDAAVAQAKATAVKVVVGDHTSCAIMSDGSVSCWGKNSDGQVGNGTTTDAPAPVALKLRGVKDVVLGTAHGCALLDDSSVTCWGAINYGKRDNLLVPAGVPGVAKATKIFAVGRASCATTDNNALVCWGDVDVSGHLRVASSSPERRLPTPARGLDHVAALSENGALHEDGTVTFWGADRVPQKTALAGVTEIASSGDEVCGLRSDGTVACVGPSTRCAGAAPAAKPAPKAPAKKTKKGTKKAAAKPTAKAKETPGLPIEVLRLPPAKHLAFDVGLCVVTKTGKLECLSSTDACKLDPPWPGLANVDTASGACARSRDGSVRCWAVDRKSRIVHAVRGATETLAIATSASHACALLVNHTVVCWGSNKHGALGRGTAEDVTAPEASAIAQ